MEYMSLTSTQAAEVLYPTLSAFHAVQGHALKSVRQVLVEGSLERLAFDFGSVILTAMADENDDTMSVSVLTSDQLPRHEDVSDGQPWREFIGRTFGWGWLIMNQQGYIDGLLIGFDGIEPQVLLNVIASSIKVSRISRISP